MNNYNDYLKGLTDFQKTLNLVNSKAYISIESIGKSLVSQANQVGNAPYHSYSTLHHSYIDYLTNIKAAINVRPDIAELKLLRSNAAEMMDEINRRQEYINKLAHQLVTPKYDYYSLDHKLLTSLASAEALLGTNRLSAQLANLAVKPQLAFQDFARTQLELAATSFSNSAKQNRRALVEAGAALLSTMTSGMEFYPLAQATLSPIVIPESKINVFSELTLDAEEFNLEQSGLDIEVSVQESGPGRIVDLGGRIIELIFGINSEAEREGQTLVFKPTNKSQYACYIIPTTVATDEHSFLALLDNLFFLLYEGSGDAKRLKELLGDNHLEPLWMLKHLRHGARHDLDHGPETEITKKNRRLGDLYKSLIGTSMPRSRAEWTRAQVALYSRLAAMLDVLYHIESNRGKDDRGFGKLEEKVR